MSFSVKVVFYKSKVYANGECPISLRMTKDRKPKYVHLGHTCHPNLWDDTKNLPKRKHPNYNELCHLISKVENDAQCIMLLLRSEKLDFTIGDFEKRFFNSEGNICILDFFDTQIAEQKSMKKIKNAAVYTECKNMIKLFLQDKDKKMKEIDATFLNNFETFLRKRDTIKKETTLSVYFRTLRAVYGKAISVGIVKEQGNPFKQFKVSKFNTKTKKRALSEVELKKVIQLNISEHTHLLDTKNIFDFSFYCRGMNFKDIALLKWTNIYNGRIEYIRAKTQKHFSVEILEPAQKILDYYAPFSSDAYVFSILNEERHQTEESIENRIKKVRKKTNADLKKIAELVGINPEALTTYVARHSWATTMKRKGVSNTVIKESMGHDSEKTTEIYLDDLENTVIDNAVKNALFDLF